MYFETFLFYSEIVNKDEAGINYNFWIYSQHQATMREVRYLQPSVFKFVKFILKNVKNCSQSMQAVEITL